MTTTRRMARGMLTSPGKDLAMFAQMARRGKRLTGQGGPFHWRFEDAEPEDAVFAVDWADRRSLVHGKPSEDYLATFKAAGWEHVLGIDTTQIFKAPPGTRPIHTNPSSEREMQRGLLRRYLLASLISTIVFVAAVVLQVRVDTTWSLVVAIVASVPFAFSVVPLISLLWGLRSRRWARAMWTADDAV